MINTKKILNILTNAINLIYVFALLRIIGAMALFDITGSGFMGVYDNWVTRTVGFAAIGVILFRFYLLYSMKKQKTWKIPHIYLLLLFDALIIFGSQYAEYTEVTEFGNAYGAEDYAFHEFFYLSQFTPIVMVFLLNILSAPAVINKLRHKKIAIKQ